MPRRIIKSYMPDHRHIRGHKALAILGDRLHHPGVWHLSRRSVAGGLALGIFSAFVPVPGQMLISALLALWFGVNLPLAVATVWITNPVTIPPMFYFAYRVGAWLLDKSVLNLQFELSWQWLSYYLGAIWKPLLLGSFTVGLTAAVITYLTVSITWRWYVVSRRRRRLLRHSAKASKTGHPHDGSAVGVDRA